MSLSADEVRHVARLARVALDEEEVERLRAELSDILAYAEEVQQVAAADVPPTAHAYPLVNVLREDTPTPTLPPEEALANAPAVEDGRFRVPAILDEGA